MLPSEVIPRRPLCQRSPEPPWVPLDELPLGVGLVTDADALQRDRPPISIGMMPTKTKTDHATGSGLGPQRLFNSFSKIIDYLVGIASYGLHIPRYRIDRVTLYEAFASWINPPAFLPGERPVANYDEDSVTMGVEAARDCIRDVEDEIGAVYFATTTPPYAERLNAGIIATALDLGENIKTADFTDSTKAGMTALISAYETVKAGGAKNVLVVASDCRLGKAGSLQETLYGDAAAAVLVGEDRIASFEEFYTLSEDFVDNWRTARDVFTRSWEDRWIREEGYTRFIYSSIMGLMKKQKLTSNDVAKVVFPALFVRDHPKIGKALGFDGGRVQPHLLESLGNTGTAYPLILLIAALEDSSVGDRIVASSYGNGSDTVSLRVVGKIEDRKLEKALKRKKELRSYEKYLAWKGMTSVEKGIRGEEEAPTAISLTWRERREILGLVGSRCRRCGLPQYPRQRICVNCGGVDMEPYRFADKKGKLFSYTEDMLAFSINRPAIYGIVEFEGGGRFWFDITDCEAGELKVGASVRMSFRRKYSDEKRGVYGYFWKAVPDE